MNSFKKRQTPDHRKSIVDLPEQLFREIFKYLDTETVYFAMRNVSQEIKKQVDQYIELRGVFIVTGTFCCSTRLIHIFKRYGNELESYYKIAPALPFFISHSWTFPEKKNSFCRILNNRIVQGNYQLVQK
jgi:hypothetical protein